MAEADDERSPYSSGGAEEKFRCAGISGMAGKSELEQMLKQMTFTRSEAQHFISLLHSRTIEEDSATPLLRVESSTTSGSMKRHKHGHERDSFHASVVGSRVVEEEIANAYKGSTICRQDLKLINNNGTSTFLSITSRASPQQPATLENLPEELLLNIFIRVFSKQLAQLRSVSKSWNALLSQPSFIKSHLNRSINSNDQIFLVFHHDEEYSYATKRFTVKPTLYPSLEVELTNFIKLPVNPQTEYMNGIRIIGSVNGLICSRYGDSIIQIWNPSLSAMLTLPPYSTPSSVDKPIKIHFGFGYDPKTDDYKVVKLTGYTGSYTNSVEWWLQVEIYSMRKGSWGLITGRFPSHITFIIDGNYVYGDGYDGHLHWLGYNCINNIIVSQSEKILAFDLGSETFREIPLPHSKVVFCPDLGVLAGKLCLMSCQVDSYELWVMEEYGVAESWVKRHVFSQFGAGVCPFGFTSLNEFLIEDEGNLVLYDSFTNEQKLLEDYCAEEHVVDKIVEYVDSLVWVAPAKQEKVDGVGQI